MTSQCAEQLVLQVRFMDPGRIWQIGGEFYAILLLVHQPFSLGPAIPSLLFVSCSAISRVRCLKRMKDSSIKFRPNKRSLLQLYRYFTGILTLNKEAQCVKPRGGYFDVHFPLHL